MSNTVNNNIPFVPENTIDPAAGLNEALNVIDMLLQLAVVTVNTNTPPASPAEGDRHVVGQAPTGAWAGRAGLVARYLDGYWNFLPARLAFNLADGVLYGRRTTTWTSVAGSGGAAWGSITGTLSAQTDLATALGLKVDKVTGKGLSTEDFTSAEKTKLSGIATGATANDTDANLKNRANHTGTQAISTVTDLQTTLDAKIPLTQRGAASGVATLDAAGKIPVSQLPPLAVNEVFTVASQAAMLALTAERGDVAIRTDQAGRAYILSADAPGTLANWISLDQALSVALAALNVLTPAADRLPYFDGASTAALAVFTAQARTLLAAATQAAQKAVLGLDLVNNTADADKPVSNPQMVALNLKANINSPNFSGTIGLGQQNSWTALLLQPPAGTLTSANQTGVRVRPTIDPALASVFIANQTDPFIEDKAGNISAFRGFRALGPAYQGAAATVSLATGFDVTTHSAPFTLDFRAFESGVNLVSGLARWNFYASGTAPNYMNGDLRIGTTTQNGTDKLTVAGPATVAGNLTVSDANIFLRSSSGTPVVVIDGPAGSSKAISLRSGNSTRWQIGSSASAESGSNAGSYFFITRHGDNGADLGGIPFWIERATGRTTMEAAAIVGALSSQSLSVGGAGSFIGPVLLGRYTLSGLPSASANINALIMVTNASGGSKLCWSNGTNWCLINTSTVVS